MENLFYNISQVLGTTIIHSLWQGLIIYGVLRLVLQLGVNLPSSVKYKAAFGALVLVLAWFTYTLIDQVNKYNWLTTAPNHKPVSLAVLLPQIGHAADNTPPDKYSIIIAEYLPYIAMLYIAGLVFNMLKMAMGWNNIYCIRQNITSSGFQGLVNELTVKMGIKKHIQVAFSELINVPCIVGYLKPLILLPCAISSYLTAEEISAILMHELAHAKRNDYLVNLIQQAIGAFLFFNPFSVLIDRIIHTERENCCDDMVVQNTGTPFTYAQALLKLEESKLQPYNMALAATGKKFQLLTRIERIMKTKKNTVNIRPALVVLVLLTFSISSFAWFNPKIEHGKIVIKNAPAMHNLMASLSTDATTATAVAKPVRKHKKIINLDFTADTAKAAMQIDTSIKNKKYKIVVEDENGNKKEYNSINDLPEDDKADFIGKTADIHFNGIDSVMANKIRRLYTSDAWKKQMAQAQKMAEVATKAVNDPAFRKMQKDITAKSLLMAQKAYGPEMQKFAADVTQHATDPEYFNSPQFQEATKKLGKYYDSPVFKKQMELVKKYYASPQFQKKIKDMTKYYDSPEFKKQMEDMGKYYDSPEFKKQLEDMGKSMGNMKGFDSASRAKVKEEIEAVRQHAEKIKTDRPVAPVKPSATARPAKPAKAAKPSPLARPAKPDSDKAAPKHRA